MRKILLLLCILGLFSFHPIMADSGNATDLITKGDTFFEDGKFKEALTAYDEAIRQDSSHAVLYEKKAETLIKLNRYKEALIAINKSLEIDSQSSSALALKDEISEKLAINTKTEISSTQETPGLEENGDNAGNISHNQNNGQSLENTDTQLNNAIDNLLEGKVDIAESSLEELSRIDSGNKRVWYWLGIIYSDSGKMEEGLEALTKAVELDPAYKDAWFAKGDVEGLLGRQEESLKSFDTVLSINGDYTETIRSSEMNDASVYYRKGVIAYNAENTADALKNFEKATELDPKNHNALYYLGLMSFAQDDLTGAAKYLDQAVSLKEDFANAWYWKGRINIEEKNYEKAKENLQKALEIDKNLVDAQKYLDSIE